MLDKIKARYEKFKEDNPLYFDRASALIGFGAGLTLGGIALFRSSAKKAPSPIGQASLWAPEDAEHIDEVEVAVVHFDDGSRIEFHNEAST